MKTFIALVILATIPLFAAVQSETAQTETESGDLVVVLQNGDWRMEAAQDCLKQMLTTRSDGGGADLSAILDATGFKLSKITAREIRQNPDRIRFGFEYGNREQVKTLYWEAECEVDAYEPNAELAAR